MAIKLMPVAPVGEAVQPQQGEAKEQQPRIPRKKRRSIVFDADGNEVLITLKCVHCNRMHPLSNFGLRKMADGAIRNQPWCRECRGASSPKKKKPVEQAPTAENVQASQPAPVEPAVQAAPAPQAAPATSGPLQVVPLTAEQALAQFRALAPQAPSAEPAIAETPAPVEPPKPE